MWQTGWFVHCGRFVDVRSAPSTLWNVEHWLLSRLVAGLVSTTRIVCGVGVESRAGLPSRPEHAVGS
jgi:hypothetical protein